MADKVKDSANQIWLAGLGAFNKAQAEGSKAFEALVQEGVNLQRAHLMVNYDLPWNPQRVEQRIGRVHRFGQKHNVVVVNFSNKGNIAEQRILGLLTNKFQLFSSVFGASDEKGYAPKENGVSPGSLHATIAHAAGLPVQTDIITPAGRPMQVGNKAKPVTALFA